LIVGGVEDEEHIPSPPFMQIMLLVISGAPDEQDMPCELLYSTMHLDMVGLDEFAQETP
jgi:hypothetical protein